MRVAFDSFDRSARLKRQRDLFRICFPETRDTNADSEVHYRWKFHSAPAELPSHEFQATRENGDLVGYYAAIPYRYVFYGRPTTAGIVCDVMTAPDCRGHGIFTEIGLHATAELQKRGVHFVTAYPIRSEVMPGFIKAGWQKAFELPIYVHIVALDDALRSRGFGFLAPAANFVAKLTQALFSLPSRWVRGGSLCTEVTDASAIDNLVGYDDFILEWSETQRHYLVKDRAFMQWRLGAPGTRYEIVALRAGDKILALAVTRSMTHARLRTLVVLDVMALPRVGRSIALLWRCVKQLARARHVEAVAGIFSRTWARRYHLSGNGFLRTPFAITLVMKNLESGIEDSQLSREDNWHLGWIDSDVG